MKFLLSILGLLQVLAVTSETEPQSCFCNVYESTLEDCPCAAETLDTLNDELHPDLIKLLGEDYFRYFQVDFSSPCKWGWDMSCTSPNCAVDTCDLATLPEHVRNSSMLVRHAGDHDGSSYVSRVRSWIVKTFPFLETVFHEIGQLLRSVTGSGYFCSDPYPKYHKVDMQFCKLDPLATDTCDYVDLIKNPEQFTGYSGAAAHQVWNTVYNELCFHPERDEKSFYLTPETAKDMCLEKRAFYKLVSGLHGSISVHLCTNYLLEDGENPVWGRNYAEFQKRFSPQTTMDEGPERIKNIYFLYLVELRAVSKISKILNSIDVSEEAKQLISSIISKLDTFPHHFQESELFKDENLDNQELFKMFKTNFMKISELMDCLGCERCKVWGKLQVTGIGTALKVLFGSPEENISLTKHEIVALLNSFGRHSTSVAELKHFREANL